MAVDEREIRSESRSVRLRRFREGEARIEHELGLLSGATVDQMPAVLVADGHRRKALQLLRPLWTDAVPRAVIAEARRIGNEPLRAEAVAEEDRLASVPGMTEIPHLVAADDDGVISLGGLGFMEREAPRARKPRDHVDEPAHLGPIAGELMRGGAFGKLGLQRAF